MAEEAAFLLKLVGHINHYQDGNLDSREVIVDCLTDLLHFSTQEGVSFTGCLASAFNNYNAEKGEIT
jgi:hypothetical protein